MDKALIAIVTTYYSYIIFLMIYMFLKRKAAIKRKEVHIKQMKAYQGEFSEELQIIANHINNQFQVPIIFFFACLLTMQQDKTSMATLALAFLFVVSRMLHSYIHLGKNNVLHRAQAYFSGVIIVGVMLIMNLF